MSTPPCDWIYDAKHPASADASTLSGLSPLARGTPRNWMRHFELQLVDDKGKGIELSDFKVTFTIDWFNLSTETKVGTVKIYNLSVDTANRIVREEFTCI
jgi:hypothetical protein